MTSSRTGEFRRCTAACPCQVCGRQKYCMVTETGDYALCTKEESDYRIEKLDGWRHFIPAKNRLARSLVRKHTASALSNKEFVDFTALHQRYTERMTTDARILVADGLGVSVEALEQFDLGFCAFPAALVIPAMAGEHQIVGLRHRRTNPSASVGKWHCEIGSTAYPLLRKTPVESGMPLIVTEGPSDCLAATAIGLSACGKWSKPLDVAKAHVIIDYATRVQASVFIVAGDNDASGGGETSAIESGLLIKKLMPNARVLTVIPPREIKDLREWVQKGATPELVVAHAMNLPTNYKNV